MSSVVYRNPTIRKVMLMDSVTERKQAIYNQVLTHLSNQGGRAMDGYSCAYLTEGGKCCAIGVLIPKDIYHPIIENMGVGQLKAEALV